jgi:citrate lyase subunit beta/citryl-CoA lyase
LCIHPTQVEIVLKYFKPSENEILNARRVIDADKNSNGAAVQLDGKMVDRPVVLLAQRILRQSKLN